MRFTDSPAVDLPVGDVVLSLQQDNSTLHVGTTVWPSSLVLVKFVERWTTTSPHPNPYSPSLHPLPSKRAIELGSGCGGAGLGLALLGLSDLLLTDTAPVLPALKRNLKRNRKLFPGKPPRYAEMRWGCGAQIEAVRGVGFDLVVAADVVYLEESVGELVEAMERLVKEDGVVLLGYQVRGVEVDRLFWEVCQGRFEVEKVPRGDLHPEYAFEETDLYFLRKKMG